MFCIVTAAAPVADDEDFFFLDFFLELDEELDEESLPHAVRTSPADSARQRHMMRAVVRRISRTLTTDQKLQKGLLGMQPVLGLIPHR
jgi:hypothetical protein